MVDHRQGPNCSHVPCDKHVPRLNHRDPTHQPSDTIHISHKSMFLSSSTPLKVHLRCMTSTFQLGLCNLQATAWSGKNLVTYSSQMRDVIILPLLSCSFSAYFYRSSLWEAINPNIRECLQIHQSKARMSIEFTSLQWNWKKWIQ